MGSLRGFGIIWILSGLTSVVAFWVFFLAGDMVGTDSSASHAFIRQIVVNRPIGSMVGFFVATIAAVLLGLFFGLACSLSFPQFPKLSLLFGYLVFANVISMALCAALVAGVNGDPSLKDSVTTNGLKIAAVWGWLFQTTHCYMGHGSWPFCAGFGVGLVALKVVQVLRCWYPCCCAGVSAFVTKTPVLLRCP